MENMEMEIFGNRIISESEYYTSRVDKYTHEVIEYHVINGRLNGSVISAEIPYKIKAICDRMINNPSDFSYDAEFMHDNYWVIVWYQGIRHAYKGTDDIWTFSARDLPELEIMHEWMYSILNVSKPKFLSGEIKLDDLIIDEAQNLLAKGSVQDLIIHCSCKLMTIYAKIELKGKGRFTDKVILNVKKLEADFPYYYKDCKDSIIEWAVELIRTGKVNMKK